MAELLMRELESASQIVLAPPNVVTHEQRLAAENVILHFRKSRLPYNNCRYLFENSHNDYVIFQAATTIKESVVKEWSLLNTEDIESLRLFLLKYITQNISLQSFAREQILQTVAVILKRGCIEDKKASTDQLFSDLTQLMSSGNVTMTRKAETKMAVFLASHNLPLAAADHLSALIRASFTDSDIAKEFQCGRTKAPAILNEAVAPDLLSELIKTLQSQPYSISVDASNDTGEKQARVARLRTAYADPMTEVYLLFYQNVMPKFTGPNLLLQRSAPMIHLLHREITEFIRELRRGILTKDGDPKEDSKLEIGLGTRCRLTTLLNDGSISPQQQRTFFEAVRTFYQAAIDYALAKLPLEDELIQNASVLSWDERENTSFESIEYFAQRFQDTLFGEGGLTDDLRRKLDREFSRYQDLEKDDIPQSVWENCREMDDNDEKTSFIRIDRLWGHIGAMKSEQLIACSMITSLLNEYSSGSRTSYIGLTWEFHMKCKRFFEENELQKVLLFCVRIVQDFITQTAALTTENMAVFNRLLAILEQTLTWSFTPKHILKRLVGSFQVGENPVLRPTESWRDVFLNPDFIQLFFQIHKKIHTNSAMAHHSLMCLTQLASLTGDIFVNEEARVPYLSNYIQSFLHLLTTIDLCNHESVHITNICKNLVSMFPFSIWKRLDAAVFEAFVCHMTKLTCVFGRAAATEEKDESDDCTDQSEAYEFMLAAWMTFIGAFPEDSCDLLKPQAIEIFNCYLECVLSSDRHHTSSDDQEIDEICEDDRVTYCDQLTGIGLFGKLVPSHCIPLLIKLIEERVVTLDDHLQQLHKESQRSVTLDPLYDDLHWLLMISCHVLSEDTQGESPIIPPSIINYSCSQSSDKNASIEFLQSTNLGADVANVDSAVDDIVRLTATVFRLWEVEQRAIERGQTNTYSPQLVRTSMWFIQRWIHFYLLPEERHYTKMSDSLISAFGQDSPCGQWTVAYILNKIIADLSNWSAETDVVTESLGALLSLVSSPARCNAVMKCPRLWLLAQSEVSLNLTLAPCCKRLLLKALVTSGCGRALDGQTRDDYWKVVLVPIHNKFDETVRQPNFVQICQMTSCKLVVSSLLESLCGIVDASISTNSSFLFNFVRPLLPDCATLLEHYHNYCDIVPVILEVFSLIVRNQLSFLSQSESQYLYELLLTTIQLYSKHHIGRHLTLNCDDLEESKFADLSTIMETLIGLMNKDFIDFGENDLTSKGEKVIDISDVVLYGLHTIIPVMNADLLKFPSLCWQYFKLITIIAETYPEKFVDIPRDLFDNLMVSVDIGLHAYGDEVRKMSLEIIESLSMHCVKENIPSSSQLHPALSHFLESVVHLVLGERFDMDLLDVVSTCFFCLVCSNQEHYQKIANDLVQSQSDESNRYRLHSAFTALTPPDFSPSLSRPNKVAFLDRFCQFLINVRAFVCIR